MKSLYKSPVITVEELYKKDVLCASAFDNGTVDFGGGNGGNGGNQQGIGEINL